METTNLILRFANSEDFERAKLFIDNETGFYVSQTDNELLALHFPVDSEAAADATETDLEFELLREGFDSFWFETE